MENREKIITAVYTPLNFLLEPNGIGYGPINKS